MNKVLIILSLLFVKQAIRAQENVELIIDAPGTLQEVIVQKGAQNATSLKVRGVLSIADISTLRDMAKQTTGTLKNLDISDVEFVAGDETLVTDRGNVCQLTDVKTFPGHCFEFTLLQSVVLPTSVERIGDYAFVACRQLRKVTIGENVRFIGMNCFNVSALDTLVIPDNVVEVGMNAFNNISDLKSVTIGKNLQKLGNGAFANSRNISEVISCITFPFAINNNCFTEQTYEQAKLTVPAGCANFYENCNGWKNFKQIGEKPAFLLSTSWNQRSPFNDDCPQGFPAGCGAIAIAQIMNHYKNPSAGFGRVSYLCVNSVMAEANFSEAPFDWDNIRDYYNESSTEAERKAVANLVFMAGAAAKTNYGTSGGTSSSATWHKMMWGLQHYLHFSPHSRYHHRRFYSTAEWTEMLRNELEAGRPVLYSSSNTAVGSSSLNAHIFVIDGLDADGNYHCNYGNYGGNRDQFTSLNLMNAGSSSTLGYKSENYQHYQSMATDFYPVDGLTDNDFDSLAVALSSPMVLEGDAKAREITAKDKVLANFTYSIVFFDNTVKGKLSLGFYRNGELVATSDEEGLARSNQEIHHSVNKTFTLPQHLDDGDYEMSIISRATGSATWTRGWSDAPNIIPVTVSGGAFTFHIPDYHCGETHLRLDDEPQIITNGADRVLEFTVHNPSDNNFENLIRVSIDGSAQTLLTSVYDGQSATYQFRVGSSVTLDDIRLSYFEVNNDEWVPLANNPAVVENGDVNGDGTVDVADIASVISVMAGTVGGSLGAAADVNGDGTVDVADIAAVVSIMAAGTRVIGVDACP